MGFWLDLGWYPGETFRILRVTIGEVEEVCARKADFIIFFHLQIWHFIFSVGWTGVT
jgi:hypothetical protein